MARSPDPQFEADMIGILESDAMNKLAAYAARGRSHRNLSEQQLTDAWKQAFKNVANDPRVYEARANACRGSPPPAFQRADDGLVPAVGQPGFGLAYYSRQR